MPWFLVQIRDMLNPFPLFYQPEVNYVYWNPYLMTYGWYQKDGWNILCLYIYVHVCISLIFFHLSPDIKYSCSVFKIVLWEETVFDNLMKVFLTNSIYRKSFCKTKDWFKCSHNQFVKINKYKETLHVDFI